MAIRKILVTNASGGLGISVVQLLKNHFSHDEIVVYAIASTIKSAVTYFADFVLEYLETYTFDHDDVQMLEEFMRICDTYRIDAIIPLADNETVLLGRHSEKLPFLFSSSLMISNACYDKWEYFRLCKEVGISTPQTCLPSMYKSELNNYLVKLRTGGLSREVYFNNPDINRFDDDYVIQEILKGEEVTIAIYKNSLGSVWGPFVGVRMLLNGTTSYLKPIEFNRGIKEFIKKFSTIEGFIGPCNIQGFIQDDDFTAFEVNLRFSGSTSLRHVLGFKDLIWAINEWLGKKTVVNNFTVPYGLIGMRYFIDLCVKE